MKIKLKYICFLLVFIVFKSAAQKQLTIKKEKVNIGNQTDQTLLLPKDSIQMKQTIKTSEAPAPIGPYSQAVKVGNTLYISGQIGIDPANGQLVTVNIIKETNQVMNNLMSILKAARMDFSNVAKTTIFLKSMNDFPTVNEVYGQHFKSDFPARETVEVSRLPKDVNVEISMIAVQ